MGQWSELPAGLLDTIDGFLSSYGDKVRVRAVCALWNSYLPKVRIRLPRLLQAFENKSNPTHGLFNLLEKKFDLLDFPELQGKCFRGSSYGWLVVTDDSPGKSSPDIFLFDTLTKVKIQLPPRYTFPDVMEYNVDNVNKEYTLHSPEGPYKVPSNHVHLCLMDKVVMSSSPSSGDCVVVAIYGGYASLAWCKHNDNNWTSLRENFGPCDENFVRSPFMDLLFRKGRLYALNGYELLVYDNIVGPNQKLTEIISISCANITSFTYLAETSDGELLMVSRYVSYPCKTEDFDVYKLDPTNLSWLEVKNIGDDMLFLGFNSSLSISSRNYPGYKGNLIYFTGYPMVFGRKRSKKVDSDIGVFNMEDGSIESLPAFKCVPRFPWPPPIWVYDVEL